jgi:hypothetical protein
MDGTAAVGTSLLFARQDHIHPSDTSRASLASPTFTGDPKAPTPSPGDSDNSIATTAFVSAAVTAGAVSPAAALPLINATPAVVGTATKYAREDHVHPTDTSRVAKAGDTMTGNLTVTGAAVSSTNGFLVTGQNASLTSTAGQSVLQFDTGTSLAFNKGGAYLLYAASTVICTWTPPGHITIPGQGYKPGGGAWADSSDARIKTVEGDYTSGLDAVAQLRPVTYTFKGNDTPEPPANVRAPGSAPETNPADEPVTVPYPNSPHHAAAISGKTFHGLIAQEVEAIFPEMVTQRAAYIDGVEVTDMRDLDTGPLIFALINAVKELRARLEVLEGG